MALELRDEFDLDDLERVRIETYRVAVRNSAGEPQKWDPKTPRDRGSQPSVRGCRRPDRRRTDVGQL